MQISSPSGLVHQNFDSFSCEWLTLGANRFVLTSTHNHLTELSTVHAVCEV